MAHRLLAEFPDPEKVLALTAKELERASIPADTAKELLSHESGARSEAEWNRAQSLGIRLLDLRDPAYPRLLLETFDPPLVLWVRGEQWDPGAPHVAIVGARNASAYGLNCAEHLAAELSAQGVTIVSGLARGIDTAAHRGALSKGTTLAVCGTGLDIVYPRENDKLSESIGANGALISEFPLGTPPIRSNFPMRNRVLAGLALGTVVVEAAERSGSLITARLALEANREVFAVPGPIFSPKSYGPHLLIRQGACLVSRWEDVVSELRIDAVQSQREPGEDFGNPEVALTNAQRSVRNALSSFEETAIDELLETLDLAPGEIYSALLELELSGIVRQLPGERYLLGPHDLLR